jgi:hypothetical protein
MVIISGSSVIRRVVYFLMLYIPLEAFLLKWLPVSDIVYEQLSLISDILILSIMVLYSISGIERFKLTASSMAIILFLLASMISFVLSQATFSDYFVKLWVFMRYIFLYLILINMKISNKMLMRFYMVLGISFTVQIFIGLLQLLDVQSINLFFEAREGLIKIIVPEDTIKGTFKFGVFFGYFILIGFALLFPNFRGSYRKIIFFVVAMLFTYLSGSRMAFIGVSLFSIYMYFPRHILLTLTSVFIGLLLTFFYWLNISSSGVENIGSMSGLLSSDYWSNSLATGRLGIFSLIPIFFDAGVKQIIFGFSYDSVEITAFLNGYYDGLSAILKNNIMVGIEDVYWISFLYYYGIIGVILFTTFYLSIIIKIKKQLRLSGSNRQTEIIRAMGYLMIFAVLAGFVNQVFYLKVFSFYFWVFSALVVHSISKNAP